MWKESNNGKSMDPYKTSRKVKFVNDLNDEKKTVTVTHPADAREWAAMYNNRVAAQATRQEGKKMKKQIETVEKAMLSPENWDQVDDVEGFQGSIDIKPLRHITPYEGRELAQQAVPDGPQLLAQLNAMRNIRAIRKDDYTSEDDERGPWGGKKTKRRKTKRRKTKRRKTKRRKN